MRILWHSTNPLAHSGYGNMTRELIVRLRDRGHFIRVATKHADHAWNDWNRFEVCEGTNTLYMNQMLEEENFDYIITLWDIWLMNGKRQYTKDKWIAYVPVDTEWISDAMKKVLKNTASQIVMSKHGERELKRVGYKPTYAPPGIDTKQFKPISGGRKAFRNDIGLDDDNFVIGTVGLNYGDDRKGFIPLMVAFKEFHKQHPEARLFIYSWANDHSSVADRINYNKVVESLKIQEWVGWPHQAEIFLGRITADMLCEIYNGFDVFCLPTKGEGFGLPLIEAPSCGIPVITTATTTGIELQEAGLVSWLIPIDKLDDSRWLPTGAWRYEPRPSEIIRCLEAAYNCWKHSDYQKIKTEVRQRALEYDWDKVWDKYWMPLVKKMEKELKNKKREKK